MDTKKEKHRILYKTSCAYCGKEVWKRKFQLETYKNSYCNAECLKKHRRTGIEKKCSTCGKLVYRSKVELHRKSRKSNRVFCDYHCATVFNNSFYKSGENSYLWKGGKSFYRERALQQYGEECSNKLCVLQRSGIKIPTYMLDVHHKDRNRDNNKIGNLEVLCVWCHVLKTRQGVVER